MEALRGIPFCAIFLIFVIVSPKISNGAELAITDLNEDNWSRMLENEWLVEFMAPWCPACSSLRPTWQALASKARDLGIHVGEVDVTTSPGLSGRFLVTALPTIYHVMNGELRQYTGPRDLDSLVAFVTASKWKTLPTVPWWRDPAQPHMSLLSHFFRLSQVLRSIHNTLLETYGLPTYGSYLIFAIATIFLGALLGLIVVCMIDFLFPPKSRFDRRPPSNAVSKNEAELINDDLVDEEEEEKQVAGEGEGEDEVDEDSDAERNSASDSLQSSDSEGVAEEEAVKDSDKVDSDKDKKEDASSSPSVRKRKPRKAD